MKHIARPKRTGSIVAGGQLVATMCGIVGHFAGVDIVEPGEATCTDCRAAMPTSTVVDLAEALKKAGIR